MVVRRRAAVAAVCVVGLACRASAQTQLYASYVAGNQLDTVSRVAIDAWGRVIVVGRTQSPGFPLTRGQDMALSSLDEAFVVVIDPARSGSGSLRYGTLIGGTGDDQALGVAVRPDGHILVGGLTESTGLPTRLAYQASFPGGSQSGFVARINPWVSGDASLVSLSYLGGTGNDIVQDVDVGSDGTVTACGTTSSTNFPTRNAYDTSFNGGQDAFVTTLNTSLSGASALLYSTYLGGSGLDNAAAVALDSQRRAVIVGDTGGGLPTLNAFDSTYGGATDAFLARVNTTGTGASSLLYSTYLGGTSADFALDVALDAAGDALLVGRTDSFGFPILNPAQGIKDGGSTQFALRLRPTVSGSGGVIYGTFWGGTGTDVAQSVALDRTARLHVAGYTDNAASFPDVGTQPERVSLAPNGSLEVTSMVVNTSLSGSATMVRSGFFGGSGSDRVPAIAATPAGSFALAATVGSTNVPTRGPLQASAGGDGSDGFVAYWRDQPQTWSFADVNSDCQVRSQDARALADRLGATPVTAMVDFDADLACRARDLAQVLAQMGRTCP